MLGPLTVRVDGRDLQLGGVKQRALLSMLALRMNDAVDVTALIDGLWEADLPEHPRRTIQVYVSRLRRLPPPDPGPGVSVIRRSDGYALVGDPETCDLNRFQSLAAKGYAAWPDDPDRTRSALHQALGLWRGEPLREFVHEPFAQAEAVRLSALHASAFDLRIEADLACGRHRQVVCELEELTPRFPLNERLHAQLMIALYRCQRQADALAVYRRLRRSLVQELAVEPMELLRVLERAILNRSPDLDRLGRSGWASTSVPVARRPSTRPSETTRCPFRTCRRGSAISSGARTTSRNWVPSRARPERNRTSMCCTGWVGSASRRSRSNTPIAPADDGGIAGGSTRTTPA